MYGWLYTNRQVKDLDTRIHLDPKVNGSGMTVGNHAKRLLPNSTLDVVSLGVIAALICVHLDMT